MHNWQQSLSSNAAHPSHIFSARRLFQAAMAAILWLQNNVNSTTIRNHAIELGRFEMVHFYCLSSNQILLEVECCCWQVCTQVTY
jgi:hypothetical protein